MRENKCRFMALIMSAAYGIMGPGVHKTGRCAAVDGIDEASAHRERHEGGNARSPCFLMASSKRRQLRQRPHRNRAKHQRMNFSNSENVNRHSLKKLRRNLPDGVKQEFLFFHALLTHKTKKLHSSLLLSMLGNYGEYALFCCLQVGTLSSILLNLFYWHRRKFCNGLVVEALGN